MSVIKVSCIDQVMTLTNTPVIASGGVNENYIEFSFCSQWDGFAKVCAFYQQPGAYYHSLLDSTDRCIIPAEVCELAGPMYFGVVGVKDGVTRTSEVVKYKLVEGVMTEITDPTEDVYQQILAELATIRALVGNIEMPEDMVTKAQLQQHTNDKDNPHGVTAAQVGAAPASHTHTPASIGAAAANHTHTPASIGAAAANHTHSLTDLGAAAVNHTHTPASIGAASLDSDGKVVAVQACSTVKEIAAAAYTLTAADAGKLLLTRNADVASQAFTITVPDDANNSLFPIGTEIEICRYYPGTVTLVGGAATLLMATGDTTMAYANSKTISDRYGMAAIKKIMPDRWLVKGEIE